MKITYIHHSSFSVELDNTILLFDYFKGNLPSFDKNKKLYVFSSHSHHDHFDESIFNIEKTHPNVEYILSNDIKTTKSQNTKFIGANERLLVDNLEIRTLDSSDLGVAFIVKVDDKIKSAIDKIKGENIDVAFLPLDSRQGNQYYLGFDYFMRNTNTKVAFPMHFFRAYSLSKIFKDSEYASTYKDKIIDINKDSQTFEL